MSDYLVRATAGNAQIRAFAVKTKDTVERARSAHNTSPVVTAALGRLLTAGVMMGAMLKGDRDVLTLQVMGDGPMRGMTVTANSKGRVKGYANVPQVLIGANEKGKLDVAGAVGKGYLRVIKDMGLKEPYIGQTALQTGEIAEDLTYYFAASEQIASSVGLGILMDKDTAGVKEAGGFIIQLMPFSDEEVIFVLEKNLARIDSVTRLFEEGNSPEQILEIVLAGLEPQITDTMEVEYSCDCNKAKVEKALISIGKKELEEWIAEGKEAELNCHFCNSNYTFSVEELKKILKKAKR